ncbi:uncharacterized protein LOC111685984 [Lucilia cuprina]|uniref:uncharacterized protein LOC111685984 n=1 Tax=Lucilia cuprina TaxID=7375 RepID=UPI001F06BC2E|nr:uncharacterized protein LOC111685984 [Lucilia cuprina]
MSITLDVNAFLNKDVCTTGCEDIIMEKEMETNIFDEIEHLLKFNKNLEFENQHKKDVQEVESRQEEEPRKKKIEEPKSKDAINLDFLNSTSDDFLLTSDSQSLLGEDTLLFTVEQDRLQPVSSRFMVPGIYKRIEGVASSENKTEVKKSNVFISELERRGRIVTQKDFERLYMQTEENENPPIRRVILLQPMESDDEELTPECSEEVENHVVQKENAIKDKIPKEWDALNRLAYDILKLTNRDHIVIDRKKNEIVRTQFNTHQKTIYRFLSPEILGLKAPTEGEANVIDVEEENKFQMNQKLVNKLGRPRKRLQEVKAVKKSNKISKKQETQNPSSIDNKPITKINTRTRSGRLVKTLNSPQDQTNLILPPPSPQENITNLLNELKDSDYQCSKLKTAPAPKDESVPPLESSTEAQQSPKRKIPPEAICPTCKKIFLGKRLQRHFAQHPEHMQIANNTTTPAQTTNSSEFTQPVEEMSLFRFLISKLQKSQTLNEDQKADLFLNELNDLVEQLQLRSSRLIRNTSGLHFVNQRCSKLLGIPEGQYALDLTAIEAPLDPELTNQYDNSHSQTHHLSQPTNISTRSLDYTNLSITLDDTLTDEAAQKLNLSAGGKLLPPSEESLLRAVDDLVQTDINKIHASSMLQQQPIPSTSCLSASSNNTSVVAKLLPPHIDHASDNAVEAVHMKETTTTTVNASETPLLDLSVDFFQFNN